MTLPSSAARPPQRPPPELILAFAPLDKAAFGAALGLAFGLVIFTLTAAELLRAPAPGIRLDLLAQFFRGYSVSWIGALIGALWGCFAGFVFGWFIAFIRNLVVAVSLFLVRSRAELTETRDFLDHI